jgi:hypothetical protein
MNANASASASASANDPQTAIWLGIICFSSVNWLVSPPVTQNGRINNWEAK